MKVVVNEAPATPPKSKYPYLGRSESGNIVLFIFEKTGVRLSEDRLGRYSPEWNESNFTPFTGSITLSNE